MKIREMLLDEHSKNQCERIAKFIGHDKERFAELMQLFFLGEYRITQWAAWPMSYAVEKYPDLIKPYYKRLLENLQKEGIHDSVIRNTVRLLQHVTIPKAYHGRVMSLCFDFVQSPGVAVAIKAFSLNILNNLSEAYPEIIPELKLVILEKWDQESAAFRSSAKKILNKN
jgi:hypothetical protein